MTSLQPLAMEYTLSLEKRQLPKRTSSWYSNLTEETVETDMDKFVVGFNLAPTFFETISREDYTDAEKKNCWFTSEECKETELEIARQLKMMEQGKRLKDKKYSSRGLENFTQLSAIVRNDTMDSAIIAVLLEQEEQRKVGETDEHAIRETYQRISHSCHLWAAVIGTRDRRDVEKYLDEDVADEIEVLSSHIRTDHYDDLCSSFRSNSMRSSRSSSHRRSSLSGSFRKDFDDFSISQRYDFMSEEKEEEKPTSGRKAPMRRVIKPTNSFSLKSNAVGARTA